MSDESIESMVLDMRGEVKQVRQDRDDLKKWADGNEDVYGEDGMRRETRRVSATGRRKAHSGQKSSGRERQDPGQREREIILQKRERHNVRQGLEQYRGTDAGISETMEDQLPSNFIGKEGNSRARYEGNVRRWKADPNKPEMVKGEKFTRIERQPVRLTDRTPSVEQQLSDLERGQGRDNDQIIRKRRARHIRGGENVAA